MARVCVVERRLIIGGTETLTETETETARPIKILTANHISKYLLKVHPVLNFFRTRAPCFLKSFQFLRNRTLHSKPERASIPASTYLTQLTTMS